MDAIILRSGPEWNIRLLSLADRRLIVGEFHRLAQLNGSKANWREEFGEVVTIDPAEPVKRLSYERWALEGYRLIEEVWEMEAIWTNAGEKMPPGQLLH